MNSQNQSAHFLRLYSLFLALISITGPGIANADLLDFEGLYGSELEERAAKANQAVYDRLKSLGCTDTQQSATAECSGLQFSTWESVREIVHTANELSNTGQPTLFSLGLDLEGLGFTLRWTAGEEFSTQESMSNSFVSGQLSGLANRIAALRSGARGFNLVLAPTAYPDMGLAEFGSISGGNAGDDMSAANFSRLGGFLNASYTSGDQDPTEREDAFDFDGMGVNGGLDYRLDDKWTIGFVFGIQDQEIDFDSSKSIVDGTVEMSAYSILPFFLYQSGMWFTSVSLGYQIAEFDTERYIRYPSLNPNVDSVDTVAESSNDAGIFTVNVSSGYTFAFAQTWSLEPVLAANFQDISIDGFRETDIKNQGFAFDVEEQNYESLEIMFGLTLRKVFSSKYGVFVPYIDASVYKELEDDERFIEAQYVDLDNLATSSTRFLLPTNVPDSDYAIYSVGISGVVRGANHVGAGGVQVYLDFKTVEQLDNYQQQIIGGGVRYEF